MEKVALIVDHNLSVEYFLESFPHKTDILFSSQIWGLILFFNYRGFFIFVTNMKGCERIET